ncbi:MAG: hypothetical protein JSC161_000206 [Candidatus Tokpelaia sp. JSC161]|nr:MAG: hypothetical protein JSC161_000206 [Candidatus Tokpelaia sp. JSC161]
MSQSDLLIEKLEHLISILSGSLTRFVQPIQTEAADCFIWNPNNLTAKPITTVNCIDISLITTIDNIRNILLQNTRNFSKNLPANNALLWGARGMGKSSLIKAIHSFINKENKEHLPLKLIEIYREDIQTLPLLMNELKKSQYRFILFCDDLSFERQEPSNKSLKNVLDGGIEGQADNVILYATSNRRHLIARNMIHNQFRAVNLSDEIEEETSLSDRFGLWLGFHPCSQNDYLKIVENYAKYYALDEKIEVLRRDALEWSLTRGNRSGRVAWQFIQELAARLGKKLRTT